MRDFLQGIKSSLGLEVYSFSVFHVFFEQYLSIGRDAAVLLIAAAAAVTLITLLFTASLWASAVVLLVLCMILVSRPAAHMCHKQQIVSAAHSYQIVTAGTIQCRTGRIAKQWCMSLLGVAREIAR